MARLRFGTLNLLHGLAVDTGQVLESDLRAAAAAVDADVLGLQEVDRGQPRSGKADQAGVVADELDVPLGTVKARIHQARKAVAERLTLH